MGGPAPGRGGRRPCRRSRRPLRSARRKWAAARAAEGDAPFCRTSFAPASMGPRVCGVRRLPAAQAGALAGRRHATGTSVRFIPLQFYMGLRRPAIFFGMRAIHSSPRRAARSRCAFFGRIAPAPVSVRGVPPLTRTSLHRAASASRGRMRLDGSRRPPAVRRVCWVRLHPLPSARVRAACAAPDRRRRPVLSHASPVQARRPSPRRCRPSAMPRRIGRPGSRLPAQALAWFPCPAAMQGF